MPEPGHRDGRHGRRRRCPWRRAGAGARWSPGQLRLRLVDARRLNPQTIMLPYHRSDGLVRVNPAATGKPLLTAQQIEDVVAFLSTLKE